MSSHLPPATNLHLQLRQTEETEFCTVNEYGWIRTIAAARWSRAAIDPLQTARRSLGEPPVSPAGMLQTCISWLAGGSYHHTRVITGTSRAGFTGPYTRYYEQLMVVTSSNLISDDR
ncbi:hypothetical protein GQ600_25327 [Phytophthora cactorum]|nr:hypothetical protein GQ600_25327 [Phytophthora cactorum]